MYNTESRILQVELRAFVMPFGYRSLNLMLRDMAKSCPATSTFFCVLQKSTCYSVLQPDGSLFWRFVLITQVLLHLKRIVYACWEAELNSDMAFSNLIVRYTML